MKVKHIEGCHSDATEVMMDRCDQRWLYILDIRYQSAGNDVVPIAIYMRQLCCTWGMVLVRWSCVEAQSETCAERRRVTLAVYAQVDSGWLSFFPPFSETSEKPRSNVAAEDIDAWLVVGDGGMDARYQIAACWLNTLMHPGRSRLAASRHRSSFLRSK